MIFQFDAHKRIFGWWQMLVFALLLLGFLIFLFPKKLFTNALLHPNVPSEVSISYLKNLIDKEPSNLDLQINLAEQEFQLGQVQEAKKIISSFITFTPNSSVQWRSLWLYFQITRVEAFELPEKNSQRNEKENILKQGLSVLLQSPYLSPEEQADLANDALALDLPAMADTLYKKAISKQVKRPVTFFAKAANAALFVKDYQSSAQFFILAMRQSSSVEKKRFYYKKAVASLNLAGVAENALKFAQNNIDGLSNDISTLAYLARLALEAGQQRIAEHYVNQLLQLKYWDTTE